MLLFLFDKNAYNYCLRKYNYLRNLKCAKLRKWYNICYDNLLYDVGSPKLNYPSLETLVSVTFLANICICVRGYVLQKCFEYNLIDPIMKLWNVREDWIKSEITRIFSSVFGINSFTVASRNYSDNFPQVIDLQDHAAARVAWKNYLIPGLF
jgi:hypothetical protein